MNKEQTSVTEMHFARTVLVYTNVPAWKATKEMATIVEVCNCHAQE